MPRTKFIVDDPMTRNAIHVLSRAPLETILVRTNDVRGETPVKIRERIRERTEVSQFETVATQSPPIHRAGGAGGAL